jgi:large subunit ribosomal protein L4
MKKETLKKTKKTETVVKKVKTANKVVTAPVYNQTGKELETITLPADIFGLPWNADLVHQVVVSLMSNKRASIAHTKDRSEVSGGGKKPWQQKGLGRARHGSTRSPIWVKGGVAHGPRNEKDYSRKVNKKMKAKALFTILSKKFKDNEVFFLDSFKSEAPKAKEGLAILKNLSTIKGCEKILAKKNNSAYITVIKKDVNLVRSFNNFGNLMVDEFRNINPLDILKYKHLIIENPATAFKFLESKLK